MAPAAGDPGLAPARAGLHARAVLARALVFALLLTASCGAKVAVDPASGGAGGADDCGDKGLPVPAAFKVCELDSQCTIAFVNLDCCGTPAAVSVRVSQLSAFEAYEAKCDPVKPVCGCDPGPAHTEDGNMTSEAGAIHASCKDGLCLTFVE